MSYAWHVAAAVLVLTALCCTGCLLYSYLLRPHTAGGTLVVVWGTGAGEDLEQRVRCLMWLQSCGVLCGTVVLADGGLDEEGQTLAAGLAARYPGLAVCSARELECRLREE